MHSILCSAWKCFSRTQDPGDLRRRIIILAHQSLAGHRAVAATTSIIQDLFVWEDLKDDVAEFVKICPHCHADTKTGAATLFIAARSDDGGVPVIAFEGEEDDLVFLDFGCVIVGNVYVERR